MAANPSQRRIRSMQIRKFGGKDSFSLVETAPDEMRPDGVRIEVKACGVNFADVMMRMGLYPEAPPLPFVPGYEVSGIVTEIGEQVTAFRVGDRVLGACRFGGYTSEIVLPEFQIRKIPAHLSFEEAAAIPVNFFTAWIALREQARVRKGDRVCVPSAAGGVGTAAVQIAKNEGAVVLGLVGSEAKKAKVLSLGADSVMLNDEWKEMSEFEAGGFQIVLDSEGGKALQLNYRRLAPGGRVIAYGVSGFAAGQKRSWIRSLLQLIQTPFFHTFRLMMDNRGVFGLNLLKLFEPSQGGMMRRVYDELMVEFENHRLKAVVGRTFPLAQAAEAQIYLQSRANIGKVILVP